MAEQSIKDAVKNAAASAPANPVQSPQQATAGASDQPETNGEAKGGDNANTRIRQLNAQLKEERDRATRLEHQAQQQQGQLQYLAGHVQQLSTQQAKNQSTNATQPSSGGNPSNDPVVQNLVNTFGGDETAHKVVTAIEQAVAHFGQKAGFARGDEVLSKVTGVVDQKVGQVQTAAGTQNAIAQMVTDGLISSDDVGTFTRRITEVVGRNPSWGTSMQNMRHLLNDIYVDELRSGRLAPRSGTSTAIQPGGQGQPQSNDQTEQQRVVDEMRARFPSLRNVDNNKLAGYAGNADNMAAAVYGGQGLNTAVKGG